MPRPKNNEERQVMIDQAADLIEQAGKLLRDAGAIRAPKLLVHFKRIVVAEKDRPMHPRNNRDPFIEDDDDGPPNPPRRPLHVSRQQE